MNVLSKLENKENVVFIKYKISIENYSTTLNDLLFFLNLSVFHNVLQVTFNILLNPYLGNIDLPGIK